MPANPKRSNVRTFIWSESLLRAFLVSVVWFWQCFSSMCGPIHVEMHECSWRFTRGLCETWIALSTFLGFPRLLLDIKGFFFLSFPVICVCAPELALIKWIRTWYAKASHWCKWDASACMPTRNCLLSAVFWSLSCWSSRHLGGLHTGNKSNEINGCQSPWAADFINHLPFLWCVLCCCQCCRCWRWQEAFIKY